VLALDVIKWGCVLQLSVTVLAVVFMTAEISSFGDTERPLSLVVVVVIIFVVIFIIIIMVTLLQHWDWYLKGIT